MHLSTVPGAGGGWWLLRSSSITMFLLYLLMMKTLCCPSHSLSPPRILYFRLPSSTFSPLRYGPFQPNTSISVITIPPSHMLRHVVLQGLPHCCMISCMFTNKDEILQLLKSPSIFMWEHYLTVDQARHYLAMLIFSIKCALVP